MSMKMLPQLTYKTRSPQRTMYGPYYGESTPAASPGAAREALGRWPEFLGPSRRSGARRSEFCRGEEKLTFDFLGGTGSDAKQGQ